MKIRYFWVLAAAPLALGGCHTASQPRDFGASGSAVQAGSGQGEGVASREQGQPTLWSRAQDPLGYGDAPDYRLNSLAP